MNKIYELICQGYTSLTVPPKGQIPALDGARALAILMVVALHSQIAISKNGQEPSLFAHLPPFSGGWVGVPLFFVLSGYFIGHQLWKEFSIHKKVSALKFIFRRGFRIWPLYYFTIIYIYFLFPDHCINTWTNIFFLANYYGDQGPIGGAWSLSTEEQFYIILPIFILIVSKFFKINTLKKFRKVLFFLILVPIITRYFTWNSINGFVHFRCK